MVAVRKISSDCTSFGYAIEESYTKLPAAPVWWLLSANTYSDFGAVVEFDVDEPIGSGRASRKGSAVNKAVSAGFESTIRQHWIQPFLPGFFFNHAIESPNTNTFNRTSTSATLTGVTTTGYTGTNFNAANGFSTATDTQLYFGRGFTNDANNGLKNAGTLTTTSLGASGLATEASPPDTASVSVVGVVVDDNSPAVTINGREITIITSSLADGGPMQLTPGTFVHVGGDTTASRYSNNANTGWARVSRVTSSGIVCDLVDKNFNPTAIASPADTIQIFVPTRIYRDHITCDDSLRTSYTFERRLGKPDTTDPHEQSQVVTGAVPNQIDIAIPTGAKMMSTMTFMGAESYRRTGQQAPIAGDKRRAFDTSAFFNTSSDLKYGQLYRHDSTTAGRTDVFGAILEGTFTLNNNCTAIPALGVFGAHDINTGKLDIMCDITALFLTVEALDLAEQGLDAGLYLVFARGNAGFIIDIPLLTVQTSPIDIAVNEPLKLTLSNKGNISSYGYAASIQFFDYLPTEATKYVAPSAS